MAGLRPSHIKLRATRLDFFGVALRLVAMGPGDTFGRLPPGTPASFNPMGIAVLDASGQLVAFAREDGASMFRFDIARAKAWGAVGMGVSSRTLAERARDNPNFFVSLSATSGGQFLPQPGAVLIKNDKGDVLGAVGASGGTGDEDEKICLSGVHSVGLKAS